MDAPLPTLPDDVQTLKALLIEQRATIAQLQRSHEALQHRLDLALRRLYGRLSERLDPRQLLLFGQAMQQSALAMEALAEAQSGASPPAANAKKGHGRRPLPADLPRHRIEHVLPSEELTCPCCNQPRVCIGQDISEQLDYTPASLFVVEHPRGCGRSMPAASAKKAVWPRRRGRRWGR